MKKMKTKMAAKVTFAIAKWLFQQFLKMIMQKPEGPRPKTVIDCTQCHQDNSMRVISAVLLQQIFPNNTTNSALRLNCSLKNCKNTVLLYRHEMYMCYLFYMTILH
jgi:hypothetical protein